MSAGALGLALLIAGCGGRVNSGRPGPGGSQGSGAPDEGAQGEVDPRSSRSADPRTDGDADPGADPLADPAGDPVGDPAADPAEHPGPDPGGDPPADDPPGDAPAPAPDPPPPFVAATWNLRNYSGLGTADRRTDALAETLLLLQADLVGLQELRVEEGGEGQGRQAWHALLDALPDHEGVHVDWNSYDSVVGLVWRPARVAVLSWDAVLGGNHYAFPRTPLEAAVRVGEGTQSLTLHIVVVHLKAFGDDESLARRRAASEQLRDYVAGRPDRRYVIVGDFNDSPYEPADRNPFVGSLLDGGAAFHFVTMALPLGTVTSLGYYHYVHGRRVQGEFLDHAVVTHELFELYGAVVPEVHGVPTWQYDLWLEARSDHFPVVVSFNP